MSDQDTRNQTLIDAIQRINALSGNEKYSLAWKRAVKVLSAMLVEVPKQGTDNRTQIGSTSNGPAT